MARSSQAGDQRRVPEPKPPGEVCPNCGWAGPLLWVHGQGQCPRCGTVLAACCEGAPLGGGSALPAGCDVENQAPAGTRKNKT